MGRKKEPKYEPIPASDNPVTVAEPMDDQAKAESEAIDPGEPPAAEEQESSSRVDRRFTKWLKVALTDEERLDAANRLAERMEDLKRKDAELDSIKNQFKGEMSRIEADITSAQNLVRDKYEFRDVPVEEVRDYASEFVTITRLDTFEIVEERRMSGSELQRPLPGME